MLSIGSRPICEKSRFWTRCRRIDKQLYQAYFFSPAKKKKKKNRLIAGYLKCGTISKITRMASCIAFSIPCDPNATLTILGTVAVLGASSIEQNASVLVFFQQWRKLTNLTSLVISSIVLYLYLNCK